MAPNFMPQKLTTGSVYCRRYRQTLAWTLSANIIPPDKVPWRENLFPKICRFAVGQNPFNEIPPAVMLQFVTIWRCTEGNSQLRSIMILSKHISRLSHFYLPHTKLRISVIIIGNSNVPYRIFFS